MHMAILLCIDSATTHASVAIAAEGKLLGMKRNDVQKDHAAFLQPAIAVLLTELGMEMKSIEGVCVSAGPGSYTGLRVGMATAKGICYALNIPLLTIPTTAIMASAAKKQINRGEEELIIPMIDARRMEVFCAVYTYMGQCLQNPLPLVLETHAFSQWLEQSVVYFIGSGTAKWKEICHHPNARFLRDEWTAADMIEAATSLFDQKQFSSLAYAAPEYSKEFYSNAKN